MFGSEFTQREVEKKIIDNFELNFQLFVNFQLKYYNSQNRKYLVAENLNKKSFFAIKLCVLLLNKKDIQLIIKSFKKVWSKIKFYN